MYDMTYVKIKHSNVDSNLDCEGDSHQTASGGGEATDTDIVIAPDTTDPDATDVSPYSILPTDEEREIIVNDALEEI
jgi:hypothetical protein